MNQQSTCSGFRGAVLADNPLGYWRLGERTGTTASDSSPYVKQAVYYNGVTLGLAGLLQNDIDSAAGFDGVAKFIATSGQISFGPKLTFEVIVKLNSFIGNQVLLGNCNDPDTNCSGANYKTVGMQVLNTGDVGIFLAPTTWTLRRTNGVSPAGSMSLGQTYHLVGTLDSTTNTVNIYINGVSQTITYNNTSSGSSTYSDILAIGANYSNFTGGALQFSDSTLDEAAIYDSILPQSRVQLHYGIFRGDTCSR